MPVINAIFRDVIKTTPCPTCEEAQAGTPCEDGDTPCHQRVAAYVKRHGGREGMRARVQAAIPQVKIKWRTS